MTLLEIHEPGETPLPHAGEGSLAVGIDLGTTNSVVAIAREGKPAALHDETGKAMVPSVVAYPSTGGVLVGDEARLLLPQEPEQRRRLGEAPDGPRRRRSSCRGRRAALRDRAGQRRDRHGEAAHRRQGALAGRDLGRDPEGAAQARRGGAGQAGRARRHHRAGLFRRCRAHRDPRCRARRRPRSAAPGQRTDGGGAGLRLGQGFRGPLRGLRSRRRHLRLLPAAAGEGRVPGAGDRRRHRAGRRRFRPRHRRAHAGRAQEGRARRPGRRGGGQGSPGARPSHEGAAVRPRPDVGQAGAFGRAVLSCPHARRIRGDDCGLRQTHRRHRPPCAGRRRHDGGGGAGRGAGRRLDARAAGARRGRQNARQAAAHRHRSRRGRGAGRRPAGRGADRRRRHVAARRHAAVAGARDHGRHRREGRAAQHADPRPARRRTSPPTRTARRRWPSMSCRASARWSPTAAAWRASSFWASRR